MPREVFDQEYVFLPRAEMLSFEEVERLAKLFIRLGVQKNPPDWRRAVVAP